MQYISIGFAATEWGVNVILLQVNNEWFTFNSMHFKNNSGEWQKLQVFDRLGSNITL